MLKDHIKKEIQDIKDDSDERHLEYKSFLESSLCDISKTSGGYFSEDNSTSEEDIKNEVDKILRDKEFLLNFKSDDKKWNTLRFIFSKWTLKEGWDNPNVFQIVKLRSSGSETSKLQEVGRGLRLPVNENGYRISDGQFYLRYLIDYSEKDFANKLLGEINNDTPNKISNINSILPKISKLRAISEDDIFIDMLSKKYINRKGEINLENLSKLYEDYPEAINNLKPNKLIDGNKKKAYVKIRKDKFSEIKNLWKTVNQKYFLKFEEIPENELEDAFYKILEKDIYSDTNVEIISKRTKKEDGQIVLMENMAKYFVTKDKLTYNEFLKEVNKKTGLSIKTIHKVLCKFNQDKGFIDDRLFSKVVINSIGNEFNIWLDEKLIKNFSYKALNIDVKETSLTDRNGNVLDELVQGVLGVYRDENVDVPKRFLYDAVIYDSDKEKETLIKSDIEKVRVFGKIPRRSIQIPLFNGGTTSPDFMYVIDSKDGAKQINFIVETKDMKDEKSLRYDEKIRIKSAEKFFETMKENGINVIFKKQLKNDDIVAMINELDR